MHVLTPEQYAIERAICDKAHAYRMANATYDRDGWSTLSKVLAAHPDYAACDNAMRGRVEQYEVLRDLPERFSAYVSADGAQVTTWTGDILGSAKVTASWRTGRRTCMYQYVVTVGGKRYTGRCQGAGMLLNLQARK